MYKTMKRALPVIIFILIQLASIAILVLWIVWYATARSMVYENIKYTNLEPFYYTHVFWLLQGIFLVVPIIFGASIIFFYWTKLKSLEKLRIKFISSISHELLTPLTSLRLHIETMIRYLLTEEKKKEFLNLMLGDTDRLTILINTILAASRIENNMAKFNLQKTNFAEFIYEFIENIKKILDCPNIEMNLEFNCYCKIDHESFHSVLKNLIENAIRYSSEKIKIMITTEKVSNKLLFSIIDNGEGINKKNLKKIFKMFYRESKTPKGTGLGLYIVQNTVKSHSGKVWAESYSEKGSTFKILLPILESIEN